MASSVPNSRSAALDFWRGFVLLTIFVNHVPGNLIEHFTPRNVGFSDSAEAFVFIAGLSLALAYGPRIGRGDVGAVVAPSFRRAFELYRAHLVLTLAAVALFAAAFVMSDVHELLEGHGRNAVFGNDTARGVTGIVVLGHQLGYFNILPLYVLLMMVAPAFLWLAVRNPLLALGVSFLTYVLVRLLGFNLPTWPEPGTWFFNPFAWQFMFTIGIVSGIVWRREPVAFSRPLFALSLAFVLASTVIVTNGLGLAPGLLERISPHLDLSKSDLATVRLVHFLALAYVVSQLPLAAKLAPTSIGRELQSLGRHGLAVFIAGSFLSAAGQTAMTLAEFRALASPQVIGVIFTLAGAAFLFFLARFLEWTSERSAADGAPQGAFDARSSARSSRSLQPAE
jgi:hypothetical protein